MSELEKAVERKNIGNIHFQSGDYAQAVKFYCEAIELCPKSDNVELPKFYQNRAAAYEHLVYAPLTRFAIASFRILYDFCIFEKQKEYQKVIDDCTSALEIDPYYMKSLTRRAKAYVHLAEENNFRHWHFLTYDMCVCVVQL